MPSVVSIHLLQLEICILFVTWPHKTTPLYTMHRYGWELLAACHHPEKFRDHRHLVRGKMLHQKDESYNYVLRLKNRVDWINTRQEKNVTTSKMYIYRRSTQKLKNICPLMTTFYNFTLKIETSWAKKVLGPFWKLEMSMLFCMLGLFISK